MVDYYVHRVKWMMYLMEKSELCLGRVKMHAYSTFYSALRLKDTYVQGISTLVCIRSSLRLITTTNDND